MALASLEELHLPQLSLPLSEPDISLLGRGSQAAAAALAMLATVGKLHAHTAPQLPVTERVQSPKVDSRGATVMRLQQGLMARARVYHPQMPCRCCITSPRA